MEIRSLIGHGAVTCTPDTVLHEAAKLMMEEEVGSLAVMEGESDLAGIITERDVLKAVALGAEPKAATVNDWMTPRPDVTDPEMEVMEAAQWMLATGYRHLPVMEGHRLLGIASIKDVLWALTEPAGRP
ncbi:MAG: CBS domain-containing protein [Acidimicrobiia bacterium]